VPPEERHQWLRLADALLDGYDARTGVYEQFAGYFDLEPLLITDIAPRRPITADLLFGRDRIRASQILKQPDVLMAQHLVPDEVAPGSLEPNLEFYDARTAHGSSLSPGIHASLLARAGRLGEAVHWLRVAADVDLADVTGTTAGGLHVATMGSVWQALVWGFAGVRPRDEALAIDPHLPAQWEALELRLRFRDVPVRVRIEHDATRVVSARPITVFTGGGYHDCGPDGLVVTATPQPQR
jgi:trehalose/maltose hydrolase-like predicted phosphorylase